MREMVLSIVRTTILASTFLAFLAIRRANRGDPVLGREFGFACVGVVTGASAVWWYKRAGRRKWSLLGEGFAIMIAGVLAIWVIVALLRLSLFLA
jgi:hypothetical protein